MAKWHELSSTNLTNPLDSPTLDTVMRFGLQAHPQSDVRICVVCSTLSKLSKGSPCPIKTTFVSVSRSGREYIWFMMSVAESEAASPCLPVMQNAHPILHPTCELTQSVALS